MEVLQNGAGASMAVRKDSILAQLGLNGTFCDVLSFSYVLLISSRLFIDVHVRHETEPRYPQCMPPLDGCYAKIGRARFHIAELGVATRNYFQAAPYRIVGEFEQASAEYVIRAEAVPNYAPIPSELVLIAGEVMHQLRSALDHLVWELVIENTGAPPPGTESAFPIFSTADGYNRNAARRIVGLSKSAVNRVQAAQPFHLGDRAEEALTWAVQQLNNTDKHRMIPVTLIYAFAGAVHMRIGTEPPVEILPWQEHVRDALQDRMEIARVRVSDGVTNASFNVPVGVDIGFWH